MLPVRESPILVVSLEGTQEVQKLIKESKEEKQAAKTG